MAAVYATILALGIIFLIYRCRGSFRRMCGRRRRNRKRKQRTYYYLNKNESEQSDNNVAE